MPSFALHLDSCKHVFEKLRIGKENFGFALAAVGSILPDLDELGVVGRMHGRSKQFLKYLLKTDPKYAPLAIGMVLHEELDTTMDKEFINPNLPRAIALLRKHRVNSGKSAGHTLIDHSIDCATIERAPSIIKLAESVKCRLKHHHFHKIAYHVSRFFNGEPKTVLATIESFRNFNLSQLFSQEETAELYSKYLFFSSQKIKIKKLTLWGKIKLTANYFKFLIKHEHQNTKNLVLQAKTLFKNYQEVYTKVKKKITTRFKKLALTKLFSGKTYKSKPSLNA